MIDVRHLNWVIKKTYGNSLHTHTQIGREDNNKDKMQTKKNWVEQ